MLRTRMDEGETLLKAGDCLVQRGTNHARSHRTDKPCRVAFIFVSAHAGRRKNGRGYVGGYVGA